MIEPIEHQSTNPEDDGYPGHLEEFILTILKQQLQQYTSEPELMAVFHQLDISTPTGVDEVKLRYALEVLDAEGLVHSGKKSDGTIIVKISRDGLRVLRAKDIEFANRKWAKENLACRCTN